MNRLTKPSDLALSSPALTEGIADDYPSNYRKRVPWKVLMATTVVSDMPFLAKEGTIAHKDRLYECWVNRYGAVSAICENGKKLGLKPGEFDVVKWHS